MAAKKNRFKFKELALTSLAITIVLFIVILALDLVGAFKDIEFITMDARYVYRFFKKPKISDDIVTLIIDDDAIEKVGRWPWSWDKLKAVVESCDYYSAKSLAFVDLNFNKFSNVYFNNEGAGILKSTIENYIMKDYDTNVILGSVENKNKDMLNAVNRYKNTFFCSWFYIPALKLSKKEIQNATALKKKEILQDRQANINAMQRFVINSKSKENSLISGKIFLTGFRRSKFFEIKNQTKFAE